MQEKTQIFRKVFLPWHLLGDVIIIMKILRYCNTYNAYVGLSFYPWLLARYTRFFKFSNLRYRVFTRINIARHIEWWWMGSNMFKLDFKIDLIITKCSIFATIISGSGKKKTKKETKTSWRENSIQLYGNIMLFFNKEARWSTHEQLDLH